MSVDGDSDTSSQTSATLSEVRSLHRDILTASSDLDKPPSRWNLTRTRSSSSASETDTASVSSGESELKRQEEWNGLFQRILSYNTDFDDDDTTSDEDIDNEAANTSKRSSIDRQSLDGESRSKNSPAESPLFVLNSEPKQIPQLTQQLRQFLNHYSPRPPLDPENATSLAEGFAETLRQVLTPSQYENATNVINSCCGQWIHSLFRLPAPTRPVFIDSLWDGRLAIAKAALQRRWPDFVSKGFRAFGNCIPTFYCSFKEPYLQQLRVQLGLPEESVRAGDDVVAMIEADLLSNASATDEAAPIRQPFLVLSHVGDSMDRFDNLNRLHALCKNEKLWLHVEGESIVLLSIKKVPVDLDAVLHADSILLNAADVCPGENVHSFVVFYRRDAAAWSLIEKLGISTKRMQLALWLQMQLLGRSNIVNGISRAHHLVQLMASKLEKAHFLEFLTESHPAQVQLAIRFVPRPSPWLNDATTPLQSHRDSDVTEAEAKDENSDSALKAASSAIPPPSTVVSSSESVVAPNPTDSVPQDDDATPSVSVPSGTGPQPTSAVVPPLASVPTIQQSDAELALKQVLPMLNQINQRILKDVFHAIHLQDPHHSIALEVNLLNIPDLEESNSAPSSSPFRSFMRFAPLTSRSLWQLSDAQVNAFCDNLLRQAALINASLLCRPAFQRACEILAPGALLPVVSRPQTLLGLGSVRYRSQLVAALSVNNASHEGDKMSELIDELDDKIFRRLSKHKTFGAVVSEARTQDGGHSCISIGLDSQPWTEKRVQQFLKVFLKVAQDAEVRIKLQDRVGEMVAASVRVAAQKLKQESERVSQQEGIIRKLPIVGSVWNWWAPVEKNIKGQSFDLLSSSLEVHDKPHSQSATPAKQPATTSTPSSVRKVFLGSASSQTATPVKASLVDQSDDDASEEEEEAENEQNNSGSEYDNSEHETDEENEESDEEAK